LHYLIELILVFQRTAIRPLPKSWQRASNANRQLYP
jgi:hypothetical protein